MNGLNELDKLFGCGDILNALDLNDVIVKLNEVIVKINDIILYINNNEQI